MFRLTKQEAIRLDRWLKRHTCDFVTASGVQIGRITYCFTPTAIGTLASVRCACGVVEKLTIFKKPVLKK